MHLLVTNQFPVYMTYNFFLSSHPIFGRKSSSLQRGRFHSEHVRGEKPNFDHRQIIILKIDIWESWLKINVVWDVTLCNIRYRRFGRPGMWHVWGRGAVYRKFWLGGPREGQHWEGVGVEGMMILKWICRNWDGETWSGLIWLRIGHSCECCNEYSGPIKSGDILD
jgi:hypothetical protein